MENDNEFYYKWNTIARRMGVSEKSVRRYSGNVGWFPIRYGLKTIMLPKTHLLDAIKRLMRSKKRSPLALQRAFLYTEQKLLNVRGGSP